jgi:hypothetical protein
MKKLPKSVPSRGFRVQMSAGRLKRIRCSLHSCLHSLFHWDFLPSLSVLNDNFSFCETQTNLSQCLGQLIQFLFLQRPKPSLVYGFQNREITITSTSDEIFDFESEGTAAEWYEEVSQTYQIMFTIFGMACGQGRSLVGFNNKCWQINIKQALQTCTECVI